MFTALKWVPPISEYTSRGFRVRRILSDGVGHVVAQLGISLMGGSCPIEDESLELRDRFLHHDSRVGASLLRTQTNW